MTTGRSARVANGDGGSTSSVSARGSGTEG